MNIQMCKQLIALLFTLLSIVSILQSQTDDRFLIHPQWVVNDTQRIRGVIEHEIIAGGDTTLQNMTFDQWFVVKEANEKHYVVELPGR